MARSPPLSSDGQQSSEWAPRVDFEATPHPSRSTPGRILTTSTSPVFIVTYGTLVCNIELNEGGTTEKDGNRLWCDTVVRMSSVRPGHYDCYSCLRPLITERLQISCLQLHSIKYKLHYFNFLRIYFRFFDFSWIVRLLVNLLYTLLYSMLHNRYTTSRSTWSLHSRHYPAASSFAVQRLCRTAIST